jgi:hypothetical protein
MAKQVQVKIPANNMHLEKLLEKVDPEEIVYIIVVFDQKPTKSQLDCLVSEGIEITHNYEPFLNAVAGRLPAKSIYKIRQYDFVKNLELSESADL